MNDLHITITSNKYLNVCAAWDEFLLIKIPIPTSIPISSLMNFHRSVNIIIKSSYLLLAFSIIAHAALPRGISTSTL